MMAKRKNRPDKTPFLEKLTANFRKPQITDDRLAILAVEIALAGGEILQENFGFTQEQTALWLDKMLDRAKINRVTMLARQAIAEVNRNRIAKQQ